jgi:hypothetical protein
MRAHLVFVKNRKTHAEKTGFVFLQKTNRCWRVRLACPCGSKYQGVYLSCEFFGRPILPAVHLHLVDLVRMHGQDE